MKDILSASFLDWGVHGIGKNNRSGDYDVVSVVMLGFKFEKTSFYDSYNQRSLRNVGGACRL